MSSSLIDPHGQPLNRAFNAKRIAERGVDEVIGLCKGVIADSKVNQQEAEFLLNWLQANSDVASQWPCNILAARIQEYLSDGYLDREESEDLLDLLEQITGAVDQECVTANMSTQLPFDHPLPEITFQGSVFCLTGRFAFGTRKDCEREIITLGGRATKNPIQDMDYLIIGCIGSRDWLHSTHGRKIEKALELKEKGFGVSIVPEDHWAECVCLGES
ncbi:MAG: BRCT domain-containing protein [Thermodesulfobacteriota bacterium]